MNKISKKIISLVTMAAFVLTLVPATAFGAEIGGSTTPGVAEVTLDKDGQTIVLNSTDSTATVNVDLLGATNLVQDSTMIGIWVDANNDSQPDKDGYVKFATTAGSHPGTGTWEGITWVYAGMEDIAVTALSLIHI